MFMPGSLHWFIGMLYATYLQTHSYLLRHDSSNLIAGVNGFNYSDSGVRGFFIISIRIDLIKDVPVNQ